MFSLVYLSRASLDFDEARLLELLATSRKNNAGADVTGLLLYKDGNFLQLLEGEEEQVRRIFGKIARDPRHFNVTVLLEGSTDERQFPDWSMGFHNLRSVDPATVPGYSPFLDTPLLPESFVNNPTRGQQILLLFRKIS